MEQCDFPRCRQLASCTYIGRGVCEFHWEEICSLDCKTEKRALKKLGLVRDNDGSVVPIMEKSDGQEG